MLDPRRYKTDLVPASQRRSSWAETDFTVTPRRLSTPSINYLKSGRRSQRNSFDGTNSARSKLSKPLRRPVDVNRRGSDSSVDSRYSMLHYWPKKFSLPSLRTANKPNAQLTVLIGKFWCNISQSKALFAI